MSIYQKILDNFPVRRFMEGNFDERKINYVLNEILPALSSSQQVIDYSELQKLISVLVGKNKVDDKGRVIKKAYNLSDKDRVDSYLQQESDRNISSLLNEVDDSKLNDDNKTILRYILRQYLLNEARRSSSKSTEDANLELAKISQEEFSMVESRIIGALFSNKISNPEEFNSAINFIKNNYIENGFRISPSGVKKIVSVLPEEYQVPMLFYCIKKDLCATNEELNKELKGIGTGSGALHHALCLEVYTDYSPLLIYSDSALLSCWKFGTWTQDLPSLPSSLEILNIFKSEITSLPASLPRGLKKLILNFSKITSLPTPLPDSLTELYINQSATSLSSPLPYGLKKLYVSNPNITSLPQDLANLEILELPKCEKIETLPILPDSLTKLNLSGCRNITSLPDLPSSLTELDLSGCDNLTNSQSLIGSLQALEARNAQNPNFKLRWPDHLNNSIDVNIAPILTSIKESYKKFYSDNEDFRDREPNIDDGSNYPVLSLMHRFLTESNVERGGASIAISAKPVTEAIEQNPKILELLNQAAKDHLEACVNQPVAGFIKISNMANVIQQSDVKSKLDAARVLIIFEIIIEETKKSGVGREVEAEAANLMFQKINNMALEKGDVQELWSGVPRFVCYTGSVKEAVAKKLDSVYPKAKEILDLSHQEFFEKMANNHILSELWNSIILTEAEKKECDEQLINLREELTAIEDFNSEEYKVIAKSLEEAEEAAVRRRNQMAYEKTIHSLKEPAQSLAAKASTTLHLHADQKMQGDRSR